MRGFPTSGTPKRAVRSAPRWLPRRALQTTAAGALSLMALAAHADPTKDQCVDADTKAQSLRRDGKLTAARDQLRLCVAQGCPQLVRDDCAQRLDEIDRVQPSIVFEAHDGAGNDLSAVRVLLDGRPWLERVDGSAVPVDPGTHTFTFQTAGQPPVTQQFIIREGDKARRERVVIGSPASPLVAPSPPTGVTLQPPTAPAGTSEASAPNPPGPAPGPAPAENAGTPAAATPDTAPAAPSDSSHSSSGKPLRIAAFVTGGIGVGGLVIGSALGLSAIASWNNAKNLCNPSNGDCPNKTRAQAQTDHDSAVTASTVSTVAFVVGGALIAGGVVLFLVAPSSSSKTGTTLVPVVGPGVAGLQLQSAF